MLKYSDKPQDKADHAESDGIMLGKDRIVISQDVHDFDDNNSQLLRELRQDLRRRSNEIRNVVLDQDPPEKKEVQREAEPPVIPPEEEPAELPEAQQEKPEDKEPEEPPASEDDRHRERFMRDYEKDEQNEQYRTQLVGMVETAGSSARRMEYLERERDTKERTALERAVNTLPGQPAQGDFFDFLLRRREDEEESPGEEDKKE